MGSRQSISKTNGQRNNTENKQVSISSAVDRSTSRYEYIPDDFPWVWSIRDVEVLDWKNGLTDVEIIEQHRQQQSLPVHIHDNVYLGNAFSVQDVSKLQDLGITRVLNLAGPMALKRATIRAYELTSITYRGIPAEDEEDYPLLATHWDEIQDFIHNGDGGGGKCVIHCVAGINRSVLAVTADYMISHQVPVLEAVKHVRKQRGNIALCNMYFQEQLVALARQHDLLGARPGTSGSIVPDFVGPSTPESTTTPSANMNTKKIDSFEKFKSLFSDL